MRGLVPILSLLASVAAATWVFRRTGADLADALGQMSLQGGRETMPRGE
jgi:hypothetical protein